MHDIPEQVLDTLRKVQAWGKVDIGDRSAVIKAAIFEFGELSSAQWLQQNRQLYGAAVIASSLTGSVSHAN